jgi:hypothetical protein
MSYRGTIKNGAIVLDNSPALPEGAEVQVEVISDESASSVSSGTSPTLYERLRPFIGAFQALPADASVNHDHYLYGTPKKQ